MKTTILVALMLLINFFHVAAQTTEKTTKTIKSTYSMKYKTLLIDGLEIFYREAGDPARPPILFLHGFPSSSHMYRNIMNDLSSEYYVIAPDYPGFGLSSSPPVDQFNYTFDTIAAIMEHFIDALGLKKINLYMQDYGGPVGFRIATRKPELIHSLIIQNANAYLEGLGEGVKTLRKLQEAGDSKELQDAILHIISYDGIKEQYIHGAENVSTISPDAYNMDSYFIERKGIKEIQAALFKNYKTNFPKYPEWQNYFRKYQPHTLIIWGDHDEIFITPGAKAYQRDLKHAELHVLNGGHFLLEEHHETVASIISRFLTKKSQQTPAGKSR